MNPDQAAAHWDAAYAQGDTTRSWFQRRPNLSLAMFDAAGVAPTDSVIDIGGGASTLVDALLDRGFGDVTVLDVSATGTAHAQRRLAERSARVQWLVADVLSWTPQRRYRVWHDRAVLHFLTDEAGRDQYLHALHAATETGSVAVFGCFAPDGPTQCSGLPVARYDASQLAALLGTGWRLLFDDREEHHTPSGAVQPFTWAVLKRA